MPAPGASPSRARPGRPPRLSVRRDGPASPPRPARGVGLTNTLERLRALYGEAATLSDLATALRRDRVALKAASAMGGVMLERTDPVLIVYYEPWPAWRGPAARGTTRTSRSRASLATVAMRCVLRVRSLPDLVSWMLRCPNSTASRAVRAGRRRAAGGDLRDRLRRLRRAAFEPTPSLSGQADREAARRSSGPGARTPNAPRPRSTLSRSVGALAPTAGQDLLGPPRGAICCW